MTVEDVLKLAAGLKAAGVTSFHGLGLGFSFESEGLRLRGIEKWLPESPPADVYKGVERLESAPAAAVVDAGGGVMVDPDLLGHEAT